MASFNGSGTYNDPYTYWNGTADEAYMLNGKYVLQNARIDISSDEHSGDEGTEVSYISGGGLSLSNYQVHGYATQTGVVNYTIRGWVDWESTTDNYSFTVRPPLQYTHTITYNANGGSGSMSNTVVTDTNSGNTNVTLASNGFTPPTNYKFVGWKINNTGNLIQPGSTYPVSGNGSVTAYAQWELDQAQVDVKVNDVWIKANVYVKVNDEWKPVKKVSVKVSDAWEEVE